MNEQRKATSIWYNVLPKLKIYSYKRPCEVINTQYNTQNLPLGNMYEIATKNELSCSVPF